MQALPVDADETFRHGLTLHSHPLRLTESRGKTTREIQSQRMGHPISFERDRCGAKRAGHPPDHGTPRLIPRTMAQKSLIRPLSP